MWKGSVVTFPVFVQRNCGNSPYTQVRGGQYKALSLEDEVEALNCSTTPTKRNKRSIVAVTCYFCVARYLGTMDENLVWLKP